MTRENIEIISPYEVSEKLKASLQAPVDSHFSLVLQGTFGSDTAREEFVQAFSSHGIAFLRCAKTPFPPPSSDDLSMIEKLARVLSGVWAHQSGEEKQ